MNTAEGLRIAFFILGIFTIFLGYIINKFKFADIIAGFNPDKYDRDIICRIWGVNLGLMGALLTFLSIIYYFVPSMSAALYETANTLIMIGCILNMILRAKYAEKQK